MGRREEGWLIGAFLMAALLFIGVAVGAHFSFSRQATAIDWVRHTEDVIRHIEGLLSAVQDSEIAERGYLITSDESFLEPGEDARERASAHLSALWRLTRDNEEQQRRLARIEELANRTVAFHEAIVEAHRLGDPSGLAQVRAGDGKRLMDALRQVVAEAVEHEEELLAQRSLRFDRSMWRTTLFMIIADAVAFAALSLAVFLLMRELNRRRRRDTEALLGRERGELAERSAFEEERVERVLEQLPVAVLLLEAEQGRVEIANRRARALFGAEVLGSDSFDETLRALRLTRADGTALTREDLPLSSSAEPQAVEVWHQREGGGKIPVLLQGGPLRDHEGTTRGLVLSVEDLSETRAVSEERERAARFRQLFTTLVGHDMRNPLSVITAGTASLQRRRLPPPEARIVERVRASADRVARMIDQMIALVQARLAGGIELERSAANIEDICRDVVAQLDVDEPQREIHLEAHGDLTGVFDEERLRSVVGELVRNALRHSGEDEPVEVRARAVDGEVELEVHGGEPIPEELQAFLFDPFRRADERVRLRSTGFGVGLYVAEQIARAHGGSLDVTSAAGEATTLRLVLPRRREA